MEIAKYYIKNTDMSTDDISFLLGYQELNSFLRAFSIWTGISVSEYKKICNQDGSNRTDEVSLRLD